MKKRIEYIDKAKGFAILLMIIGHCLANGNILKQYIYVVHMPLFYITSGYFYKIKNNYDVVKSAYKGMIIPYIITSIIIVCGKTILAFFKKENVLSTIIKWIGAMLYGTGETINFFNINIEIIGAIWFLLSLFWIKIIFNYIYKIKNKKLRYTIIITLPVLGFLLSKYIWLPLSIEVSFVAIIFYFSGYIINNYHIIDKWLNIKRALIITMIFVCGAFFTKTNVATNYYNLYFFNFLMAMIGAILILYYFSLLKGNNLIDKIFKWLGNNSLYILCIHAIDGRGIIPWRHFIKTDNVFLLIFIRVSLAVMGTILMKAIMNYRKGK